MPEDGFSELGLLVIHEFLQTLLLLVGHVAVEGSRGSGKQGVRSSIAVSAGGQIA